MSSRHSTYVSSLQMSHSYLYHIFSLGLHIFCLFLFSYRFSRASLFYIYLIFFIPIIICLFFFFVNVTIFIRRLCYLVSVEFYFVILFVTFV